ncbi:MAG: class I SAM-dependent methyltransferase [Oscillospiraceae bacterium]|nr:class I SAM-dependent methyltransferase [Oscillospiraceae bacterium]
MRTSRNWNDYELLDASGGERLERWGKYTLIRPDPQVMWAESLCTQKWRDASARYIRSDKGGGHWQYNADVHEFWNIKYKDLTFKVKPTGFKHTGVFPEQAVNWDFCDGIIREAVSTGRTVKVLNLFAYTGGATMACLNAGADVCHLDAVKSMVEWAKENAKLSGLLQGRGEGNTAVGGQAGGGSPRWIVDDAAKFLSREIKRGNRYDAVILDPPSYGRGTGGEMWKLEDCINSLLLMCGEVLSENPLFLLMNSYTTGLSPSAVEYLMQMTVGRKYKIKVEADEIGLPVKSTGLSLPCGNTAIAFFN